MTSYSKREQPSLQTATAVHLKALDAPAMPQIVLKVRLSTPPSYSSNPPIPHSGAHPTITTLSMPYIIITPH